MPIIDPDGLFNGDRLRRCSNMARLHWPYLFLASNGFGRLEINYFRIVSEAFRTFNPVPSEAELTAYIAEYVDNWLLFLYEHDGQKWGAWDTPGKFLSRWRTSKDRSSPAPPEPDFTNWIKSYRSQRNGLPKSFRRTSAELPQNFSVVVGVGIGIGVGKTNVEQKTFDDGFALTALQPPPKLSAPTNNWFSQFWAEYWLHVAKKPAQKAFDAHVKTEAQFVRVMKAVRAQKPVMIQREPSHRPHAATWLNAERWNDEIEADPGYVSEVPTWKGLGERPVD